MQKIGYSSILLKLLNAKHIFLIELDDNQKRKVNIKEVRVFHIADE